MEVKHCKQTLIGEDRDLKPTPEEAARGITSITAREYWCTECRKRLFYRKDNNAENFARVRPHQMASFRARLRRAKESDWVKSSRKEFPYTEMKAWVK